MRLLWAKWANIPRIIISNLARTWGTEESSSEQTAPRSSVRRSLNEYSSVKPLMDLLQLSRLQGSSGHLPENLPAEKKARPPRSFPPEPWNCCHLSVPLRIARMWIGSGQWLKDLHSARSVCLRRLSRRAYTSKHVEGKNAFKVSFIKALTPRSRLKVKKGFREKLSVLNGYF